MSLHSERFLIKLHPFGTSPENTQLLTHSTWNRQDNSHISTHSRGSHSLQSWTWWSCCQVTSPGVWCSWNVPVRTIRSFLSADTSESLTANVSASADSGTTHSFLAFFRLAHLLMSGNRLKGKKGNRKEQGADSPSTSRICCTCVLALRRCTGK